VLSTDQKGNIAEAAVALSAAKLGFDVYRPITEGGRYDLIIDSGERLLRVQCKWAARHGDVIVLRCYSARRSVGGKLINRRYTRAEVDMFAAYSPDLDQCFLLPPKLWEGRRQVHLRISPALNNQARGINWARDFELAVTLGALGAVAQLGERRRGTPKATGSSPVGSTFLCRTNSPPLTGEARCNSARSDHC
jgi:hypothetical protein